MIGKLLIGTLIGLATGGIAFLLYRNAAGFFRFLRDKKNQLAPIIEGLVKRFVEKVFLPAGVQDLTDDLSTKVSSDVDALLLEKPEMDRDEAVRKVIGDNVNDLQGQIEILKENGFESSLSGGINRASFENIMNSNTKIDFLKTGLFTIKLNQNNLIDLFQDILFYQKFSN